MGEEITEEFYLQYGIKTCSLRIFSAYGPGLKKQLFWDLNQKLKNSTDIVLYGTGKESRDFIYISDLVNAIACVIKNGAFTGDVVNVANGEEITIKKVATTFYNSIQSDVKINFGGEHRIGDPINWIADINKLKQLGYQQKISIEQGVLNYIKWLKELE